MLYECSVCGYIYDEEAQGISWDELAENWACPLCDSGKAYFSSLPASPSDMNTEDEDTSKKEGMPSSKASESVSSIDYPSSFKRTKDSIEKTMDLIHQMAIQGHSVIEPMRTQMDVPAWENILIAGAQLNPTPLDEHAKVITSTVIGKNAKRPLIIDSPIYITHMSFGALSKELKLSLAKGSAAARTAMCSGEGGILPESMAAAHKYIFEYVPNLYSVTDENLKNVDAIEIKIGQGTKPGMGGHLPKEKITDEIAAIRNKDKDHDIISPSKFKGINTKDDLKQLVDDLRERSDGRPIGIKIAAGRIEKDLDYVTYAQPDFITVDGRGGSTGASPKVIKDSTTIPTIYALYRAKKYLTDHKLDISLVITGGFRLSSDMAKALAMGADAIAIGTAAMIAASCQQYKVCHKGKCPVGCATQDPKLRQRLNMDNSAIRVYNYLNVCLEEIKTFARITGQDNIHQLNIDNLMTTDLNISTFTNIPHV